MVCASNWFKLVYVERATSLKRWHTSQRALMSIITVTSVRQRIRAQHGAAQLSDRRRNLRTIPHLPEANGRRHSNPEPVPPRTDKSASRNWVSAAPPLSRHALPSPEQDSKNIMTPRHVMSSLRLIDKEIATSVKNKTADTEQYFVARNQVCWVVHLGQLEIDGVGDVRNAVVRRCAQSTGCHLAHCTARD